MGTWAAATDLETRLVETGLATVQKTDFRNFAHGRHLGLSRMAGRVSVIAMSDAPTKALVGRHPRTLAPRNPGPASQQRCRLSERQSRPAGPVDAADRPCLGQFRGSTLPDPRSPSSGDNSTGSRADVTFHPAQLRRTWSKRLRPPRSQSRWRPFAILTAGRRDGCDVSPKLRSPASSWTTTERSAPPRDDSIRQLSRCGPRSCVCCSRGFHGWFRQRSGQVVAQFAARSDCGTAYQSHVLVGLYNGAIRGSIDDRDTLVPDLDGPFVKTAKARRLVRELERIANRYGGRVDERPFQVSVELPSSRVSMWPACTKAVDELIARENAYEPAFKAVGSAHSIDVIPATSSKNLIRKDLAELQGMPGRTLAVGDRGGVGGNDFELLAFDAFTLSVDEVSGDPTRCWNLAPDDRSGPELLTRYLLAIKADRRRIHTFRWNID